MHLVANVGLGALLQVVDLANDALVLEVLVKVFFIRICSEHTRKGCRSILGLDRVSHEVQDFQDLVDELAGAVTSDRSCCPLY